MRPCRQAPIQHCAVVAFGSAAPALPFLGFIWFPPSVSSHSLPLTSHPLCSCVKMCSTLTLSMQRPLHLFFSSCGVCAFSVYPLWGLPFTPLPSCSFTRTCSTTTLQMWRPLHALHHITSTQISQKSRSGGWQRKGPRQVLYCAQLSVRFQIDMSDQPEMTLRWVAMQRY